MYYVESSVYVCVGNGYLLCLHNQIGFIMGGVVTCMYIMCCCWVTGYVPLSRTKIDFSSDLEKADPTQKKKKKRV